MRICCVRPTRGHTRYVRHPTLRLAPYVGLLRWRAFRTRGIPRLSYPNHTLMRSTPMLTEILAMVRKVKLCVPPTQREISDSLFPIRLANSLCEMCSFWSAVSILSAMANDQSTSFLTSGEMPFKYS